MAQDVRMGLKTHQWGCKRAVVVEKRTVAAENHSIIVHLQTSRWG
jgi:hypothetical protein